MSATVPAIMSQPWVTAVIPARGGSKRLPGKNLQCCAGRSLLWWAIDEAMSSARVDRVVVSSDDDAILRAAEHQGAYALHRPAVLATDTASTDDVLLHAVRAEERASNIVVCLQPTSPYRPSVHGRTLTDACLSRLEESGASSILTATRLHLVWACDRLFGARPMPANGSRSDPGPVWHENGAVFAVKTDALLESGTRVAPPAEIFETPWLPDIDIEADLRAAEALLLHRS